MTPTRLLIAALLAAALSALLIRLDAPDNPAPLPRSKHAEASPTGTAARSTLQPASPADPVGVAYVLEPPYLVLDAVTFATEGGTPTRLAFVEGPAAEAVCTDAAGRLWACGLGARAALNNLVRKRAVPCRTVGPPGPDELLSTCSVDGADLAAELVGAGFARPLAAGTPLDGRMRQARDAGRGLWAGGWSIRP